MVQAVVDIGLFIHFEIGKNQKKFILFPRGVGVDGGMHLFHRCSWALFR